MTFTQILIFYGVTVAKINNSKNFGFPHLRRTLHKSKATRAVSWWQASCQWSPLAGPGIVSSFIQTHFKQGPSDVLTPKNIHRQVQGLHPQQWKKASLGWHRLEHTQSDPSTKNKTWANRPKNVWLSAMPAGLWNNGLEARKQTDRNLQHLWASKVSRCSTVNLHDQKMI